MLIVNVQNVQIEQVPDPQHPERQISILSYLDRQYALVQVFAPNQMESVRNLWRHLTADRQSNCLVVKTDQDYSIWVEKIQSSITSSTPKHSQNLHLELVFRAQLYSIDGLWKEVQELLGTSQSADFGNEILAIIPTIKSIKDLHQAIEIAQQLNQSISGYMLLASQLSVLQQGIGRVGGKYLGRKYLRELLSDIYTRLSPQLKAALQAWLKQQPS